MIDGLLTMAAVVGTLLVLGFIVTATLNVREQIAKNREKK